MKDAQHILTQIIYLGQEITQVKDVDLLLEKILTLARNFTNADAGSIYVKHNHRLFFKYAQNDSIQKQHGDHGKLIYSTFSLPADNTSIAGYVAHTGRMVNIPNVYALGEDVPFSFDKTYDVVTGYKTRSVLAFPLKTPQEEILGVLQLINAKDGNGNIVAFNTDDEPFIMYFANSAAIALERAQLTREIILRMLRMAEMRDPKETGAHVNRVGAYAAVLYETWASPRGISKEQIEKTKDILRMAAMLHDVGKVAISDLILKKPARLNVDEFEIMKQHTFLGARLFADSHSEFDVAAFYIALEHHERWDGMGYPGTVIWHDPFGVGAVYAKNSGTPKRGEEIHLYGRIVAVADVYDALSSKRCYKDAWNEDQVLRTIREESGRHFDPDMVIAFFKSLDALRGIRKQYPDDSDL
ncbi:MAG: HD domain-containing protein [Desulfobacterota bacterium]|nr:HD domain-containing protein [Thermodesulfobacteriota bacterium]